MGTPALRIVRKTLIIVASTLIVLGIVAAVAVYVLTGTDWGHERVRRVAQGFLSGQAHGKVTIGSVSGNLLTGMTVHDFAITDSSGAPFVSVESFSGKYSLMSIAHKRIWLEDAVAVRPRIVLDRPPGEHSAWNWQHIFPRDTTPKPATQQTGWLDWLRFTNARVVDGQLIVRTPWSPSSRLSATARDSAIRTALAGKGRLMIARSGGGFQKVVQLDSVNAKLPLLRLSEPGQPYRLAQVASLSMIAFPFRPPGAIVKNLRGAFPFTNDSAWWHGAYAELPNTKVSGDGMYSLSSGDMSMTIHGDPVAFADVRWIYPRLPADGHGSGNLKLTWRGAVQDYLATNTDIDFAHAHVEGDVGVTLGDTLTIHDTKVAFRGLDTRTLEQLIGDLKSPRQGTFSGHAALHGGRHAMALNGDVTFADRRAGVSRVIGDGEVGFLEQRGVRARNLRLRLLPFQVAMARTWYPSLPIAGTVTGTATLNGSTQSDLGIALNLDHRDRGTRSVVEGKAAIRLVGQKRFDVDVNAKPVSLEEVGRFAPALGLQGSAAGPIHLTGLLSDLRVNADLRLPDGGRFSTVGTLNLAARDKSYDLTSSLYTLNLNTIDTKAPVTSLTAHAALRGSGTSPETMTASLVTDLSASRWIGSGPRDSISVDTASVRASVARGLLTVDKLYAVGAHTFANASGSFGITKQQTGTLSFSVSTDSLGAYNRLLPKPIAQTGPVPPRPQNVAKAVAKAKADSTRVAKATEMERLISGNPGPGLVVNAPKAVPGDTLSGKIAAKGTLNGNIYAFDLKGTASGQNVVARGNSVRRFQATFAWTGARTPQSALAATVSADTVTARGFAFDSVLARGTYTPAGGHLDVAVTQSDNRRYSANGDYALYTDRKEVRLATLNLKFDTLAVWTMSRPSSITWGGPGVQVNDFELRNTANGRIYANGLLPTEGIADFALTVENFPIANLVDILQTDVNVTGIATANVTMAGTLTAPAFRGTFNLAKGTYNGVAVPNLVGRLGYADRSLVTHIDAMRANGLSMATVDGRIPINLALSGATGSRLLPDPMTVDLVADSLPLELIPQFTGMVSDVHGLAAGKVSMRGTLERPVLSGNFNWTKGSMTLVASGARFGDASAVVHMANDTVIVDSVTMHTRSGRTAGTVRLRGGLAVGDWREPAFNLYMISEGAELLNNTYGKLRIDAGVALTGPFREPYLSGAATIVQGVVYAPEPGTMHALIGAGDPALYNLLDTTSAEMRELFPIPSPFMANLRMELALGVKHDTWVRNREANVEVYTEDPLSLRQENGTLLLTGAVTTDRGEYEFLSKRFQIKRGSALFIGSPDLNPTLQITGEYQVNVAARGALNIRVIVGGTLHKPKLALESDAQPPKTQSELLSLLAFGQSSATLIATTSSSIGSTAGTNDLFGAGAQAAVQRLAGVAMGVAVQQVEMQAGRAFGTDVFDITPGDVPLFNSNGPRDFFTQTRIDAGKYVNPRTFVSVQEQAGLPGLSLDHRTANGWRFFASTAPRIVLREPTLSQQPHRTLQSYGGFVLREWRF